MYEKCDSQNRNLSTASNDLSFISGKELSWNCQLKFRVRLRSIKKMYLIALGVSVVILISSIALIVKKLIEKYFPKDFDKFFQSIDKFSSRKILKVKLFYKDLFFVNDPELIHKVLNSEVCLEKPRMIYKFFGLNDGLLCCKCKLLCCPLHKHKKVLLFFVVHVGSCSMACR